MLVRIDAASSEPLFRQIAGQVRSAIAAGPLAQGDRLPAARELADALEVNMHTVLRAYAELRDDGLLELRRRRGAVVRGGVGGRARLLDLAGQLSAEARRQGVGKAELRRLVEGAP